jgi:N-acetyl-alpha-D-muramate 1-phosphate uridylyltransferase
MQAVILAGGLATRIRPLTNSIPKSLIEIEGKPFIAYQLDILKQQGLTGIVLCVGYLGEQIASYLGEGKSLGISINYSYETNQLLGTAGALKNAEKLLEEQFLVIYGDSYLFLDLPSIFSYFNQFDKLGLMTVYRNQNQFDQSNVIIEGNLVKVYNKKQKLEGMDYIDYGALLLRRNCLNLVPNNQAYSLEELLVPLVNQGQILAYKVKQRFYEIGSLKGIADFKKYVKELKATL